MDFWEHLGGVIFDMDGVIFIGKQLRAGVKELVGQLEGRDIDFHILTNTGSLSSERIAANLASMGLAVDAGRITTSSEITVRYVAERTGARQVFTVGGGAGLAQAAEATGIEALALEHLSNPEIARMADAQEATRLPLITGWTRDYDHELATRVLRLRECVSDVYVTGEDRSYPGEDGLMPGVLWLSASVAALTGKQPINPAKPNPYALEYVLRTLKQTAMPPTLIGDSVSDIEGGNLAGCRTVLVLGGTTSRETASQLKDRQRPGHVIEELTELLQVGRSAVGA